MDTTPIEGDLQFVKEVLRKSEGKRSPRTIYFLWAAIVLVGFALVDFAPVRVGIYWMIAGPAGGVISAILGYREGQRLGQRDADIGIRHCLHWLGMMGAIALVVILGITGAVGQVNLGRIILVIVALGYFLAGIHLERPLMWIGLLMGTGYVAILFISGHTWTVVGAIIAISMVAAAFTGERQSGATVS
ncbi:MAG TPA: hypothetical protein VGK99_13890 [Acidobacteriota bacterium]